MTCGDVLQTLCWITELVILEDEVLIDPVMSLLEEGMVGERCE